MAGGMKKLITHISKLCETWGWEGPEQGGAPGSRATGKVLPWVEGQAPGAVREGRVSEEAGLQAGQGQRLLSLRLNAPFPENPVPATPLSHPTLSLGSDHSPPPAGGVQLHVHGEAGAAWPTPGPLGLRRMGLGVAATQSLHTGPSNLHKGTSWQDACFPTARQTSVSLT